MPGALFWLLLLPHLGATLLLWAHTAWRGAGGAYGRGLADGFKGWGTAWRARRAIQANRKVSLTSLAGQFAWSPLSLLKRAIVLRQITPP
jgi:hypothetical protein